MKIAIVSTALAVALASCTTSDLGKIDTAIQRSVPFLCKAAEPLHASFQLVAATGKIKESTVVKEQAAWEQLQLYCADPSSATLVGTLGAVTAAYLVIKNAAVEAKRAAPNE